jgi:peptidyl-prolyl cis-trans isomerase SurA
MKKKFALSFLLPLVLCLLLLVPGRNAYAQPKVVDRIVAVVGKSMILESEIEAQYLQYRAQGNIEGSASDMKCRILEQLLLQKLLLNQAALDSVEVTDSEVEQKMDERLRYFIAQFGSQQKLEEFYQKSIIEIKEEFRDLIRDQLKEQKVQQDITKNVIVTPSDVKSYYRNIPKDSLPLINSSVEIQQLVKIPPVSPEQKTAIKEKLRELRKRILAGESFSTLAILYSEDPGSAKKGGELGFYGRGELYPEFEAAAFKLKEGEVSDIVETKAGFHIIQLIERKGDYINVRHILMKPKTSPEELEKSRNELDSISKLIKDGTMTFDEAVTKFSDDPSKNSAGLMINPATGGTTFEMDQLEPQVSFVIDKMEVGQVSAPVMFRNEEGLDGYRLLKLKSRTEPHRANLDEDYSTIQDWAMQQKQNDKLTEWVDKNVSNAYVMIIDEYKDCNFEYTWFPKK